MATALGNARPRGRGRGRRGLGGAMPTNQISANSPGRRGPGGLLSQGSTNRTPVGQGMNPSGRGKAVKAQRVGGGGKTGGVASAGLPGPGGRQLAARVSSGAITQEQAQKTMQQRQTLQKAFGSDWRNKLQVGGKSFAQVRAGLAKNPDSAQLAAINKKLAEARKKAITTAREKNYDGKTGF